MLAVPALGGDLCLFLNDSVVLGAVEHLTTVISSMRGSGQKHWSISAAAAVDAGALVQKSAVKARFIFPPDKKRNST